MIISTDVYIPFARPLVFSTYRDKIIEAGTHNDALKMIEEEFPEIEWNRPRREVFNKSTDGVNKKQLAYLLELIAQRKWEETYPKANTIRKYILSDL